jgi:hypothetical protein
MQQTHPAEAGANRYPGTNLVICNWGYAEGASMENDLPVQEFHMPGPILTIPQLLRQAADALEAAYKERADAPPAVLSLVAMLRERAERLDAPTATPEEPELDASTVTQDEP